MYFIYILLHNLNVCDIILSNLLWIETIQGGRRDIHERKNSPKYNKIT